VPDIEIKGGASEYEAAAMMAVLARLTEEASAWRASLPPRRRPAAWVRRYLGTHPDDPLPEILPDLRGSRSRR